MCLRQKYGMHAHVDARFAGIAPNRKKLHDIAERLGIINVLRRNLRDALD